MDVWNMLTAHLTFITFDIYILLGIHFPLAIIMLCHKMLNYYLNYVQIIKKKICSHLDLKDKM